MPFKLYGRLSLDAKGFNAGLTKAKAAAKGFGAKIKTAFGGVMGKLAAVAGTAAIIDQVRQTVEWASKVRDLSDAWGISTAEIQKFMAAAGMSGIEIEDLMDGMKDLGKSTSEALTFGAEGKLWAFRQFGIDIEALKSKNPAELFRMIAQTIKDMGAVTAPDALKALEDLMGGAGIKTLPMMRRDFEALMQTVGDFGMVTDETVQRLATLGDKWEEISQRSRTATAGVLGGVFELIDGLGDLHSGITDMFEDWLTGFDQAEGFFPSLLAMLKPIFGLFDYDEGFGILSVADRQQAAKHRRESKEAARKKKAQDDQKKADKAAAQAKKSLVDAEAKKRLDAETKKKADAKAAATQQLWGGAKGTGLERIGGRIGVATTAINISQKQLALMVQAQEKRAELAKNLRAIAQAFNN